MIRIHQALVIGCIGLWGAVAWPISPLGEYQRASQQTLLVNCGDSLDRELYPSEYLRIIFNGGNSATDEACYIKIRTDVMDPETEKYGLRVNGSGTVSDPANDESCGSSYLIVSDKDDEDDDNGRSERYCGSEAVNFKTHEDIIRIELNLSPEGSGEFTIDIRPHYLCGGVIEEEGNLSTPDYPQPYANDLTCIWTIKAPENTHIQLEFIEFDIFKPKNPNKPCKDKVTFNLQDPVCGDSLVEPIKTFQSRTLVLALQTIRNYGKHAGFVAQVSFIPDAKKKSLLSKFFNKN